MKAVGARRSLALFLQEDRSSQDVTSVAVIPHDSRAIGELIVQGDGTLSGLRAARELASLSHLHARALAHDGERVRNGQCVLVVRGNTRRMLAVERTMVNLVMHLSGIATETSRMVARARAVRPGFRIAATRKTIPGLRDLEKEAVTHGGGETHRRDLSAALLVKGNHVRISGFERSLNLAKAYVEKHPVPFMMEVHTPEEALASARGGAVRLLLDNLKPSEVRTVIQALEAAGLRPDVEVEVTGGIAPANVTAYARTGADLASSGHLTHSSPALPMHLVVRPLPPVGRRRT